MVFDAAGTRSPVSPTLPVSSARAPLSNEPAGFAVRRTTNSWVTAPVLWTLNVTLPAAAALAVGSTSNSRSDTPIVWASAGAATAADGVTAGEAVMLALVD